VTDAFIAKSNTSTSGVSHPFPEIPVICHLYEHTSKATPIRRLLVDLWLHSGNARWFNEGGSEEEPPPELLVALCKGFYLHTQDNATGVYKNGSAAEVCERYHKHPNDGKCYRRKAEF